MKHKTLEPVYFEVKVMVPKQKKHPKSNFLTIIIYHHHHHLFTKTAST